jgi:eukaryotic-like serine/threonine-protein kinase
VPPVPRPNCLDLTVLADDSEKYPISPISTFRYAKPTVDVWAAAACLYRMLTGMCPRDFPRGRDAWHVVLDDLAVPLRQRNPAIPTGLAEIIDWALTTTPEIGCQNVAELRDLLQGFLWR